MIRAFLIAAAVLLAAATNARADPVWCALTNNVVTGGCVVNQPVGPAWTSMDSSDARYTAFIASEITNATVQTALNGTVTLSSGTTSLNGTYPATDTLMILGLGEGECFLLSSPDFCEGSTTVSIPDVTGTMHVFTATQFKNFMIALLKYRAAILAEQLQIANGQTVTPPSSALAIQ